MAATAIKQALISVDDHVQEPPDLWTACLSKSKWGDRVPHLERTSDGNQQWIVDGQVLLDGHAARAAGLLGDRNQEPRTWDEVPAAAYVPAERLRAMDAAGVDYSVLYPTVAGLAGETFGRLTNPELEIACVQAYNDWLIEEWAAASPRFIPQCIVPLGPAAATVAEIRRAVAKGHRGVVFPAVPMDLREVPHVAEPDYDPVWAVCEELDVPLCLHAGAAPTLQYPGYEGLSANRAQALDAVTKPVSSVFVLSMFLFSRILIRHPKLRVVFAESALSWGMLYLEWADHQADHDGLVREGFDLTPSQIFRRQCYFDAWYDAVAPFAPYLGIDRILWSTNLPLATSTWPRTQETIDRCFEGVTPEDRAQVLWDNAASLYRI
ncbi:MAG TPA: amidohydrolase family protein [Chloroflexota bacterium]